MLLVTPALLPAQEQEEDQDQEQEQEQEEDAPLCNYFSTNLFVFLDQARPVVAQRSRSGRARALARSSAVSDAFRTTYDLPGSPTVPRVDFSHLYSGMRLSTFRNRCSHHRRQQRFSETYTSVTPVKGFGG